MWAEESQVFSFMRKRTHSDDSVEEAEEEEDGFAELAPAFADDACEACWTAFRLALLALVVIGLTAILGLMSSALETSIFESLFKASAGIVKVACQGKLNQDQCLSATSWFDRVVK